MPDNKPTIRVAGIENDSITDGPGLRFVLFMQGCPFHCEGCHNPHTLPLEGGNDMSVDEIMRLVESNPLLSGVTLSGGEPFIQAKQLVPLAKRIKQYGLELAAYSGFTFEQLLSSEDEDKHELLKVLDILIDGPFIKNKKSLDIGFRGSANQRFINAKESFIQRKPIIDTSGRWEAVDSNNI